MSKKDENYCVVIGNMIIYCGTLGKCKEVVRECRKSDVVAKIVDKNYNEVE